MSPFSDVSWSPSLISTSVPAGQNKTINVSFQSVGNLRNVVLRVVPELQSFVSVAPHSFATVAARQSTTVAVTISSSALLPPTTIEGAIQIRSDTAPGETIAIPLPIAINFIWSTYHNEQLGFSLTVPPSLIARSSTDPVVKEITFLMPPAASENDVIFLVKIAPLPTGQTLEQAIENGGIDPSSIGQITLGGRAYFRFASQGQSDGTVSYASTYPHNQIIIFSAPVGYFASSPAFSDIIASLSVLQ